MNDFDSINDIYSVYQPLVSIRDQKIAGFEALIRNRNGMTPGEMFDLAQKSRSIVGFDRICRKSALENFSFEWASRFLLSINLNGTAINKKTLGSGNLLKAVEKAGLRPENIIIEILEAGVEDIEKLCVFTRNYHKLGFLIALDDVGSGSSNLNRISMIKPDIIKIDKFLTDNYRNDFYKFEVLKSLIALSHKIGAVIVAEGIERPEQAVDLTLMGADLLQGYYFSRPEKCVNIDFFSISEKLETCADACREAAAAVSSIERQKYMVFENCRDEISKSDFSVSTVLNIIRRYPAVECVYFLSEKGIQCSETICDEDNLKVKNRLLFSPAKPGTDHSLKDYYLNTIQQKTGYITQPYISKATGRLCVTKTQFADVNGEKKIMCIDVAADPDSVMEK